MTTLVVRRLLIDLEAPLARRWCGGDAFRTAFFNALSMSFPVGEQFFIDSVRQGLKALPEAERERFQAEVQGFIGQEATHRRIHALFNGHLQRQGLDNAWEPRSAARLKLMEGIDARHWLAVTAATEHFTAIFAEWLLGRPQILEGAEERLRTMWLWHCAEEAEHKSTAFDLYRALGGNQAWRLTWFRRITMIFLGDLLRQTVNNLRRDGALWRPSTWASAWRTLFGRDGIARATWAPWRAYLKEDFHPAQQHSDLPERWLETNRSSYTPVGSH